MKNVLPLDETFIVQETFFNDIPAMQTVIHTFLPETCLIKPSTAIFKRRKGIELVKLRKRSEILVSCKTNTQNEMCS
jgi:hypothetical protein